MVSIIAVGDECSFMLRLKFTDMRTNVKSVHETVWKIINLNDTLYDDY